MDTKTCTKCGVDKPLDDFYEESHHAHGVQSWCKTCMRDNNRPRAAARGRALSKLRRRHPTEFAELFAHELEEVGLA